MSIRVIFFVAIVLLLIIFLALFSRVREGYPTQKTYTSFADRMKETDNTYAAMDRANLAQNSLKQIGPDVTPMITSSTTTAATNDISESDFLESDFLESDFSAETPLDDDDVSSLRTPTHFCDSLNGFLLRETAISNMMSTNLTAEQRMQSQNFMNLLNAYMIRIQRVAPSDAANWVRRTMTRDDMVQVVVDYARGKANDLDSKKLVQTFNAVQQNSHMMAYIKSMLLQADMTDAHYDCTHLA
jgi:hypothetical protein